MPAIFPKKQSISLFGDDISFTVLERCSLWTITAAIFCKLKVHGGWHAVHPSSYRRLCRFIFSTTWHCLRSFHPRYLTAISPNHPRNPSTYSPLPGACAPAIYTCGAPCNTYIYAFSSVSFTGYMNEQRHDSPRLRCTYEHTWTTRGELY